MLVFIDTLLAQCPINDGFVQVQIRVEETVHVLTLPVTSSAITGSARFPLNQWDFTLEYTSQQLNCEPRVWIEFFLSIEDTIRYKIREVEYNGYHKLSMYHVFDAILAPYKRATTIEFGLEFEYSEQLPPMHLSTIDILENSIPLQREISPH